MFCGAVAKTMLTYEESGICGKGSFVRARRSAKLGKERISWNRSRAYG
jgi:hypothetical protein